MYNYILRAIQALFGHEAEITYTEKTSKSRPVE